MASFVMSSHNPSISASEKVSNVLNWS